MNALTTTSSNGTGGNSMVPQNMDQAVRLAEMMSRGKLVPAHLHASPGDCLMVIELAMRLGMSPFAVAQCTSVISGKLMLEGKLVAAAVESSGQIVGFIDYEFTGEGADLSITVSATRRGESGPRTIDLAFRDAKTTNGMWVKQPKQQLVYAGTRVWARRWLPSVMLGVYSPEEMIVDHDPQPVHVPLSLDGPQTRATINAEIQMAPAPKRITVSDRLDALQAEIEAAAEQVDGIDQVEAILARDSVQAAGARLKGDDLARFNSIIRTAMSLIHSGAQEPADASEFGDKEP